MEQESTHIPAQEKYTLWEQGMDFVSQSSSTFLHYAIWGASKVLSEWPNSWYFVVIRGPIKQTYYVHGVWIIHGSQLQEHALYMGPCLLWWLVGLQGAQLRKHIDATLGSGNLREAVRLPPGEDLFEWLAVNSKILLRFVLLLRERERERAIKILLRFIDS
jgi:hypothetical protein